MKEEYIQFVHKSPYGDYHIGEYGLIVGFCRGGDDVPCAVIRKANGRYVMAELTSILHSDLDAVKDLF